jgi:hypothetical protein
MIAMSMTQVMSIEGGVRFHLNVITFEDEDHVGKLEFLGDLDESLEEQIAECVDEIESVLLEDVNDGLDTPETVWLKRDLPLGVAVDVLQDGVDHPADVLPREEHRLI